jgi:S-adenosylmethionine-diacylglycerol 3-amino-3-carboxypropyl transferase
VELKVAALSRLSWVDALAFLGAIDVPPADRLRLYQQARAELSPAARAQWDTHQGALRRGVIGSGVTERFLAAVVAAMRAFVHPRSRIEALLRCRSVEEQRALYRNEWNSRRWRALFKVLINRATMNRAYDPAFFQHVENPSFARHFYQLVERSLCELPIRTNYFLHQMLTGVYPAPIEGGLPPYLTEEGARAVADRRGELTLVDAPFTAYLKTLPDRSLSGYSLSNICEWLTPQQVDELFAEIARTAAPDAVLCFRNFVGWTEVPERWRARVVEDRPRGEAMIARDRSAVQRRFAVCKVLAS